jgi:hypothetical protein
VNARWSVTFTNGTRLTVTEEYAEDSAMPAILQAPVSGFTPGTRVWPKPGGPMALQHAPQTVIASYTHPVYGTWLWLDDDRGNFSSFAAGHWTTKEPDDPGPIPAGGFR